MKIVMYLLLAGATSMYSCGNDGKNSDVDSLTAALPSAEIASDTVTPEAPVSRDEEGPSDERAEVVFSWVELTEKDGKYVIKEYCDAENRSITLNRGSAGLTLVYMLGQEALIYEVHGIDSSQISRFEINCMSTDGGPGRRAVAEYIDQPKGIAKWKWMIADDENFSDERIFVKGELASTFPVDRDECDDVY